MDRVKAINMVSGDDDSITINVSTECIPMDLVQYTAYWELRRTMSSSSEISKNSTTSEIYMDIPNNAITVFINGTESKYLYGEYLQYLYLVHAPTGKKKSLIYGPIIMMESFDTVFPATHYCDPEDIAMQLKMLNPDGSRMVFTETTSPRRSDVIDMILQAEAGFDRDTKNSWRETFVTEEYHDIKMPLVGLPSSDVVVSLRYSNLFPIDTEAGDKIEFWNGSTWLDYATSAQTRGSTWWVDYKIGQIHFNNFWPWFNTGMNKIRCAYRWGNVPVPDDIKEACIKMVSIRLLQSDFNKLYIMNQRPNVDWNGVIEMWKKDIEKIVSNHRRTIFSFVTR